MTASRLISCKLIYINAEWQSKMSANRGLRILPNVLTLISIENENKLGNVCSRRAHVSSLPLQPLDTPLQCQPYYLFRSESLPLETDLQHITSNCLCSGRHTREQGELLEGRIIIPAPETLCVSCRISLGKT
jgi:hypothetical protein